jgi:hypothetical protein
MLLEIFSAGATGPASQAADGGDFLPIGLVKYNWCHPCDADHVRIEHAQTKAGGNSGVDGIPAAVEVDPSHDPPDRWL